MSDLARFSLKLRFSGESVEARGLDLYDGSTSLHGLAQAMQIVLHAYMRNDVVTRATPLKGAEIRFSSPRQGSVLIDVVAFIEKYPATLGIGAPIFYDFVKTAFSKALGKLSVKAETPTIQMVELDGTFFDQLSEVLEGSLQRAHRAIDHGREKITIERPRSELVMLNATTSLWVNTRDENPGVEDFSGSITRYNSITGNGRALIRELKRVIPFRPGDGFPEEKRGLLTWSLHGNTVSGNKELKFRASKIESATGDPKRLILADCSQA
ncbi:hypothetical protein [uncultured Sphingomonas sp.]|uniref:DUF7946 domain-containing protein n=1 Tax=uncultured Sphingomonas sp. TaxID=158754 RepID=UPI0026389378|nr:hypothetical protein [uncultured Sphingomonas sp.]